jgi:single-stranded DNA-binding protein
MTMEFTLKGRLGKDPELAVSDKGNPYARLYVASDGRNGRTDWYNVTVFGPAAESLASASKGDQVAVIGQAANERWKDADGVENVTAITARDGGAAAAR